MRSPLISLLVPKQKDTPHLQILNPLLLSPSVQINKSINQIKTHKETHKSQQEQAQKNSEQIKALPTRDLNLNSLSSNSQSSPPSKI